MSRREFSGLIITRNGRAGGSSFENSSVQRPKNVSFELVYAEITSAQASGIVDEAVTEFIWPGSIGMSNVSLSVAETR